MYLKDRLDLNSDTLELLLDHFGEDATVDEVMASHYSSVFNSFVDVHKNYYDIAHAVIERARLGL